MPQIEFIINEEYPLQYTPAHNNKQDKWVNAKLRVMTNKGFHIDAWGHIADNLLKELPIPKRLVQAVDVRVSYRSYYDGVFGKDGKPILDSDGKPLIIIHAQIVLRSYGYRSYIMERKRKANIRLKGGR